MTSVVQLRSYPRQNPADDLLVQLDSAQKLLIESIAELARATSRSESDRFECAEARLRIGQASLARSAVFNSVCELLRARIDADQWIAVAALRAADTGLRLYCAAHQADWPDARVDGDWTGYCLESKGIRMRIGELIQRERAILFPLLEQVSRNRLSVLPARDPRVAAQRL